MTLQRKEKIKARLLIITIMVISTFVLISFAMPNLSEVYGSCEMTQAETLQFAIGYQSTNGLLYIDNAECTWKLFGIISIVSILSEEEKEAIVENTDEQTVYSLPFGINPQDIELQPHEDPQYIKNLNNSTELVLDIDAMIQVQKIFDKCDYKQKLESGEIPSRNPDGRFNAITGSLPFFNNGTHYVDSNLCKWIDSFDSVEHNCSKANPMEQSWYDGPSHFYNDTHHIDIQYCKWILFSEDYWDLPLCDPNPEHDFGKCREFR